MRDVCVCWLSESFYYPCCLETSLQPPSLMPLTETHLELEFERAFFPVAITRASLKLLPVRLILEERYGYWYPSHRRRVQTTREVSRFSVRKAHIVFHTGVWIARATKRLVSENKYTEKLERVIEVNATDLSGIHRSCATEDEADGGTGTVGQ